MRLNCSQFQLLMRLKILICVLILFLNFERKYQTPNLKPHYSAYFNSVPVLTVHHNWHCSGVPLYILIRDVILHISFIYLFNSHFCETIFQMYASFSLISRMSKTTNKYIHIQYCDSAKYTVVAPNNFLHNICFKFS